MGSCVVCTEQGFRGFIRLPTVAMTFAVLTIIGAAGAEQTPDAEGERFFVEKIEPLLREHCYACHSHSSGTMEGGLTLDARSGWATGGSRGPAIVPGNPDASLLIVALRYGNADLQMPPDDKLPDEQIELLAQWIRRGAPDSRIAQPAAPDRPDLTDWWSLRPLQRPLIPDASAGTGGEVNPIDAFIWQRQQSLGLSASPQADRRALIRRVFFDLHGLPPTPDEVTQFVADPDPAAYEKLVDRLLESPRYGERWARHWLDTVHFADSHGCEHDVQRLHAWRFRDYVITSFNRDTSWPRFIREQLAADRFFPEEPQLTAALGFVAAGPLELSRAGTAPVTFDYLDRDDMVAQTMAAFTSTTANCARCHDHKFDPITQQDYYALQAVFAGIGKGDVEYDADPAIAQQRQHWHALLLKANHDPPATFFTAEYTDIVAQWEHDAATQAAIWTPLVPVSFTSSDGATLQLLDDHSLLASGTRPDKDTYTIAAPTSLTRLTALRLDVLADDRLPMRGPGRQDNGNLHLTELEVSIRSTDKGEMARLQLGRATADWDQTNWTIAHALDGDLATAWGIHPQEGQSHCAVIELAEPCELPPASEVVVCLKQLHGAGHLIGRLRLSVTDTAGITIDALPAEARAALALPHEQRSPDQQAAVAAFAVRQQAQQGLAALPPPQLVYAVSSSYSHGKKLDQPMPPKTVHVLQRGDIDKPGEVASPGALSAVPALPARFALADPLDEAARRAALADWIADPDNPLTWRSVVNRMWAYHFGRGLCDTPNDLGHMGDTPSHPELLDWLATWFRDDGQGSLKELHRIIVRSATYQQSSDLSSPTTSVSPLAVDAENRLLWRMNRRRLDAESFRDAVLQIAGRLDLTVGGPGIEQFTQTKGAQLTPQLDYDAFDWHQPGAGRRSIYRVVWRGIPDPFLESLDFPDLGLLAPTRGFSVSALQSLALFNNDFVLHHSQLLAENLAARYPTLQQQVVQACSLVFLRQPDPDEVEELAAYAQAYGLAAMCRVLFNSNEFLFVD